MTELPACGGCGTETCFCRYFDSTDWAPIKLAEALQSVLNRIDSGEVELKWLTPKDSNGGWYFGYPEYSADGWKFCVFDDCYEWDYLEWVESPEGVRIEYPVKRTEEMSEVERVVWAYEPKNLATWGY